MSSTLNDIFSYTECNIKSRSFVGGEHNLMGRQIILCGKIATVSKILLILCNNKNLLRIMYVMYVVCLPIFNTMTILIYFKILSSKLKP